MIDYKNKYNDALEKIRKGLESLQDGSEVGRVTRDFLEDIFPELKESEDEKIRKALIKLFTANNTEQFGEFTNKQFIAWLKRQDDPMKLTAEERERFAQGVLKGCALSFVNYLDSHLYEGKMCVSNMEYEDIENAFLNTQWDKLHRYYCKFVEKEDEQQDFDDEYIKGVQRNFDPDIPVVRTGDWIVQEQFGVIYHIVGITYPYCTLEDQQGLRYSPCWLPNNDNPDLYKFHLWTIEDAKDGDVLATSAGAFIYNGNNGGGSCPGSYCGINTLGKFQIGVEHHWTGKEVHPATKEQRDLLFQKMQEAGYEWDVDKKELKRIENQQHIISSEAKEIKCDKHNYWSEEDEYTLKGIIDEIEANKASGPIYDFETYDRFLNWLKSIKKRIK